ncbi:MAG: septum formation initiator family protein [Peptococcaceae bacterium]|nr:septum formation initiator family protein [Peptococcaceae bacterium]
MSGKKNNPLAERLRLKKAAQKQENASILQEGESRKNWSQVLIAILLIYASMSFMNGCFSIIDLKAQDNAVVAKTREAQVTQKQLENDVSYMKTDAAVEKTAREDLKMVKPGEILLTQREESTRKNSTDDSASTTSDHDAQSTSAQSTAGAGNDAAADTQQTTTTTNDGAESGE